MKLLTSLLVLLLPLSADGQSWFPDGAVWHYNYNSGFGQDGYVRMEVTGDTSVQGQMSRKVVRVRNYYDYIGRQHGSHALSTICVYEAADIVRVYVPQIAAFDTLYNMAAVPGDQWRLPAMPGSNICGEESKMVVVDTGTTTLNAVPLRWLAVDIHYAMGEWSDVARDTIVERIGTHSYLLPFDPCLAEFDGHEGGLLRCYRDTQIDHVVGTTSCDFTVGLHAIAAAAPELRIHPNPGRDRLHITSWQGQGVVQVSIHDLRGAMLLSLPWHPATPLDVAILPPGLYLIRLHTPQRQEPLRWIKL